MDHLPIDHLIEFIAQAPPSIAVLDLELRYLAASNGWINSLHLPKDIVGRRHYDLFPELSDEWKSIHQRCMAGETLTSSGDLLRRTGEPDMWVRWEVRPWRRSGGDVGGIIIYSEDITERITAEMALTESHRKFKALAERTPATVLYLNTDLVCEFANTAFCDWVGLDPETVVGKPLRAMFNPEQIARREPNIRGALEGLQTSYERAIEKPSGEVGHLLLQYLPDCDHDGRVRGFFVMGTDITDLKAAHDSLQAAKEDAEAANRAKSMFLANVSHEIRTPLNGVIGMAQAMAADNMPPRQRERLDVIQTSGRGLMAILNDVLDMAKIESGKLELEDIEFDLYEVICSAFSTFVTLIEEKGLTFDVEIADNAKGRYLGDPTRLRQIVFNLISNACKFTKAGEVRLDVSRQGADLVLKVEDTGIGLSPEQLGALFKAFSQADSGTTRRFGGTGLGLSISQDLARMMGGGIEVLSAPDRGSTFTLRAPLTYLGEATAVTGEPPPPRPTFRPVAALRVLAAEDNGVNRLVLQTLLEQIGFSTVMVENGAEALDAWRVATWDLILMDVQMPVMDGLTATHMIRAEEALSGRVRTPIIAVTANTMVHHVAECRAAGMDGHIGKPLVVKDLMATLEAVYDRRSRHADAQTD